MPDTFTLTICLGNDAMQTPADIADALRKLAAKIQDNYEFTIGCRLSGSGIIRDVNGNKVGIWEVA